MCQLWMLFGDKGLDVQIARSREWHAERRDVSILVGIAEGVVEDCTRGLDMVVI